MSRICIRCLLIGLFVVSSAAQAVELKGSAKHCLVSPDVAISDGQGLPPDFKKFIGFFSGYWGEGELYHTLWVANITSDGNVTAYYANEAYEPWSIYRPSCNRHAGKIEDKVLTLTFRNGTIVKYWFSDANILTATYERGGRTTPGQFKRHD